MLFIIVDSFMHGGFVDNFLLKRSVQWTYSFRFVLVPLRFCVRSLASGSASNANKPASSSPKLTWFLMGPLLFEAVIANSVLVWCVSIIGTAQLKKVLGWAENRTSTKAPDSICGGSSFGSPCKGNVFKKGSESGPRWNQEWFSRSSLAPSLWQIFWSVDFTLKLIWPATAASGSLNWGGPFLRACFFLFWGPKKGPFFVILFCFNFHRLEAVEASKLALTCFVLISTVLQHWSSRLALKSAFNFVSSYKLFVLLQFPSTWSLEACLEAIPLRQLRPKILAR